jgi:hypothetical protein
VLLLLLLLLLLFFTRVYGAQEADFVLVVGELVGGSGGFAVQQPDLRFELEDARLGFGR